MKNRILSYILLTGLAFSLPGCQDFLVETNPNQISTDSFWKNLDDADAGLVAVYNSFKNGNILLTSEESLRADLAWPGFGRPNTQNAYYIKNFNNGAAPANSKWDALYKGIFRANQVIVNIDKLLPTYANQPESLKRANYIKGQAHFFRGLFYSYLHQSFNQGAVPIIETVPQNEADFYKTISPADQVQAFFIKDLELALTLLPGKWALKSDLGRVTAGAASAVLGTTYLYAKDYAKAATYFKDVISNPAYGYSLAASVGDNFTTKKEFNSESILEISYSTSFKAELNVFDENNVSSTFAFAVANAARGGFRSILPSLWIIMAYKTEPMDPKDPRNIVKKADGTTRLRSYSLRASNTLALVDDLDQSYYGVTSAQGGVYNNAETAYYRKYSNWDIVSNEKDILPQQRSAVNHRVIRLADVFLMYAECLVKGGTDGAGVSEALRYINKVRQRSALQLIGNAAASEFPTATADEKTYTAKTVMDHLMYVERPLELALEGHAIRLIDMRRWGITKQRFEELSQQKFYGEHYPFVTETGTNGTRWGSVLTPGTKAGYPVYVDYQAAAANYIESAHAYWPIPNSETITNPELIKK